MPSTADSAIESDPALGRRRFRRVIAQVITVQIATLVGLWLLSIAFGAS